jgi:hypothetical protein
VVVECRLAQAASAVSGLDGDVRRFLSAGRDFPVVAAPLGQAGAGAGDGLGPAGDRTGEGSASAGEPALRVVLANGALLGVPRPPPGEVAGGLFIGDNPPRLGRRIRLCRGAPRAPSQGPRPKPGRSHDRPASSASGLAPRRQTFAARCRDFSTGCLTFALTNSFQP